MEYPVAILSKDPESFPAGVRGPGDLFDAQLFGEPSAMVRTLSVKILLRLPGRNYLQN